jgi:hypothetical protein
VSRRHIKATLAQQHKGYVCIRDVYLPHLFLVFASAYLHADLDRRSTPCRPQSSIFATASLWFSSRPKYKIWPRCGHLSFPACEIKYLRRACLLHLLAGRRTPLFYTRWTISRGKPARPSLFERGLHFLEGTHCLGLLLI